MGPAWKRVWAVAALVALLLVAFVAPRLAAPPGDSHDGRNAGTWGLGARALVDDPVGSRLGAVRPDGTVYANHPPAVVVAASVATVGTGGHPLGLRLPALAASLASLALLVVLLRTAGLSPLATALGIAVAGTSAMFLTYGTMLDTPVLAMPTVLAALVAVERARRAMPLPAWAVGAIGLAGGLVSWTGLLAALLAAAVLLAAPGPRRQRVGTAALLAGGVILGGLASVGWAWWAHGDLDALRAVADQRTEQPPEWWEAQRTYLLDLFGPIRLGLVVVGVAVALVRRRHRLVLAASLLPVLLWARAMGNAAAIHDYWNYLGIVALALATGIAVDGLAAALSNDEVARLRRPLLGAAAVAVGVIALAGPLAPSVAELTIRTGNPGGELVQGLERPSAPDEVVLWSYAPTIPGGAVWAAWTGRGTAPSVGTADGVAIGDLSPDAPVLLRLPPGAEPSQLLEEQLIARSGSFVLVPASLLQP